MNKRKKVFITLLVLVLIITAVFISLFNYMRFNTVELSYFENIVLDKGLNEAILLQLGNEKRLTKNSLKNIESLTILSDCCVNSLEGIDALENLRQLHIFGNEVDNIDGLSSLGRLEELDLSGNNISTLECLKQLKQLKVLKLADNNITDITPLAGLINLEELSLDSNNIEDIQSLESLLNLKIFSCSANNLASIKPIGGMRSLEMLILNRNPIKDINYIDYKIKPSINLQDKQRQNTE